MKLFDIVVAYDLARGIGKRGALPWPHLKRDMARFKALTSTPDADKENGGGARNAVIMGRKTFLALPAAARPLPQRVNIVLTSQPATLASYTDVRTAPSLDAALALCSQDARIADVFVIGGARVFADALRHPQARRLHATRVFAQFDADVFMPPLPRGWRVDERSREALRDNALPLEFVTYARDAAASEHAEHQYLRLIRRIIDDGVLRGDRTGTGTLSLFGAQTRWDLRESFPLLTTKRVFWRGLAEELLWFVRGSTDAKLLQDKNVHIWDGNGSREFLDSRGLTNNREGDLGPVYGFQWRHFGAAYAGCDADYSGKGVDQLAQVIDKIRNNPTDRRMCLSAWNPAALDDMALPPCHMFAQFYVADGELSCQMYQRSCDMGLGVPFNIASYALLTCMIAHVCGLKPGDFVHSMGDAHVYLNHVEPLREQLQREPRAFPKLRITRDVKSIDDFVFDDFELTGYKPHKKIQMDMAV